MCVHVDWRRGSVRSFIHRVPFETSARGRGRTETWWIARAEPQADAGVCCRWTASGRGGAVRFGLSLATKVPALTPSPSPTGEALRPPEDSDGGRGGLPGRQFVPAAERARSAGQGRSWCAGGCRARSDRGTPGRGVAGRLVPRVRLRDFGPRSPAHRNVWIARAEPQADAGVCCRWTASGRGGAVRFGLATKVPALTPSPSPTGEAVRPPEGSDGGRGGLGSRPSRLGWGSAEEWDSVSGVRDSGRPRGRPRSRRRSRGRADARPCECGCRRLGCSRTR